MEDSSMLISISAISDGASGVIIFRFEPISHLFLLFLFTNL